MPLSSGTKIHVIERRLFDGDIPTALCRRNRSGGELGGASAGLDARPRPKSGYVRSRREQMRIVPLTDANLTIRILPPETRVAEVQYRAEANRTIVSDGQFELEIADFGAHR